MSLIPTALLKCFSSDGDDLNCKISRRDLALHGAVFYFQVWEFSFFNVHNVSVGREDGRRVASVRQSSAGARVSRWYAAPGRAEPGVCLASPSKVKPVGFDLRAGRRCLSRGGQFPRPGERGDYEETGNVCLLLIKLRENHFIPPASEGPFHSAKEIKCRVENSRFPESRC